MVETWMVRRSLIALLSLAPVASAPATVLPSPPLGPDALGLATAAVRAVVEGELVARAAATLSATLVGSASFGYVRPVSSSLQSVGVGQTRIEVPGAEGLLCAEAPLIQQHLAKACKLASPFVGFMRDARPDLVAAVEYVCSFAGRPEAFEAERDRRVALWDGLVGSLSPAHEALSALQSTSSSLLLGAQASLPIIEAAARGMGWPDTFLTLHRVLGFPTVGDYPDCGVFRRCERAATQAYPDLDHPTHNSKLARRILRQWQTGDERYRSVVRKVTQKKYKEVALGVAMGPFTSDEVDDALQEGGWRALQCFGIEQGMEPDGSVKVRPCDNGRASLTNECLSTHETLACESASFPALVASLFAEAWPPGVPSPALLHSTDDVELAYRRMAALDPGTTVVALYDTTVGAVRFFLMPGHNFGLAAAVLSFNRVSQCVAAIARRYFGVPCAAYYDDYSIAGPSWAAASSKRVLRMIHERLGIPLAGGLKDVLPRPVNVFLGVVTDLSRVGIAVMRSKPERVARAMLAIAEALHSHKLLDCASFLGKIEYLQSSATTTRVGRAALGLLRAWESERPARGGAEYPLSELACEALLFLLAVLPRLPPRTFDFRARQVVPDPPIVLYTDAMGQGTFGRIGIVIYDPLDKDRKWRHASSVVPPPLVAAMRVRKQYIMPFETVAPVVALLTRPAQFKGRHVILFVDNTGALFGLGKGDCHDVDSARMVHVFHTLCAALGISVWLEYVPSGANISDLPSRDEFALLESMGSASFSADLVWPDLQSSLAAVFGDLWAKHAPSPSRATKRQAEAIDSALADIKRRRSE